MNLPPLSAYVHVPWCVQKCPYCDFNSHAVGREAIPEQAYLKQLLIDLEQDQALTQGRPLQSVFFGGGTPSLLNPSIIGRIIEQLHQRIGLVADCEITLEANPGTVDVDHFRGFYQAGVNRLSLGVQSFHNEQLSHLGRIHDGHQAVVAFEGARKAGFSNINIDLMHALPEQSENQAMADLQQAIELAPEHLSWYQLTIEPNTEFYRKPPQLPNEENLWQCWQAGRALLKAEGYVGYEVSAYSQAGFECRHNLNYWQYGDFIGLGPGAHGKITSHQPFSLRRTRKTRQPKDYLQSGTLLLRHQESIAVNDRPFDYFMNTLRLVEGVPLAQFETATGMSLASIQPTLDGLIARKLLMLENGKIRTTRSGFDFLNEVLIEWLP